jgi:hypothetical protein
MSFLKRVPREIFRSALTFQFLIIAVFLSPSAVSSSPSKNLTVEEAYPGLATGMLKLAKLSDLGKGEILRITGPHSFMPFFSSVAYFLKQFCRQQRTVPEPVEPLHSMSL